MDDSSATHFFSYKGVESFQNILATKQGGNTILYAVGFRPAGRAISGYIIAEYN